MALDTDKIDDAVLALLYLTLHDYWRAWKGFDWDALDRLYQKGLIADPVNKAKSVVFTEEGLKRAEELFRAPITASTARDMMSFKVVTTLHAHSEEQHQVRFAPISKNRETLFSDIHSLRLHSAE